jgi:hypothetical protein
LPHHPGQPHTLGLKGSSCLGLPQARTASPVRANAFIRCAGWPEARGAFQRLVDRNVSGLPVELLCTFVGSQLASGVAHRLEWSLLSLEIM